MKQNFAPNSEEGVRLYLERWKQLQLENGKSKEEADSHIGRYGSDYCSSSII